MDISSNDIIKIFENNFKCDDLLIYFNTIYAFIKGHCTI